MVTMRNYEDLANAIVEQAARDYREALAALKKNPESVTAQAAKTEVECFFHSRWYTALTQIEPEWLMRKLKEEADSK